MLVQHFAGALGETQHDFSNGLRVIDMTREDLTVFFVKMNAPNYFSTASLRAEADALMRKSFVQLYDRSPDVLHGVCAFGERLAFYTFDKKHQIITLEAEQEDDAEDIGAVSAVAPIDRWSIELFGNQGYNAFVDAVADAKRGRNLDCRY